MARRLRLPSPHALRLLADALMAVVIARLALSLRRSERLRARAARARLSAGPAPVADPPLHDLREISWSVAAAARCVPGASCLTQALAGEWLLAQRGREAEIRLTLPVDVSEGFRPHAWLLSAGFIVLGGDETDFLRHRPFLRPGARPGEVAY